MDGKVALKTPWLVPLSKGFRRSTVACRLTAAETVIRDCIRFIDASLPMTRNTSRYSAACRVVIAAVGVKYTGVIERTAVEDGVRRLWIRVVE
jgi:hypothetical protein